MTSTTVDDDLIERLKFLKNMWGGFDIGRTAGDALDALQRQAAEIETLEAEVMRCKTSIALSVADACELEALRADAERSRILLARALTSMRAAVDWAETGNGRPPQQTCLFEIADIDAAMQSGKAVTP